MTRLIIFLLLVLSLLTACASGTAAGTAVGTVADTPALSEAEVGVTPTTTPEPPSPFAYDDTIPFDVIVNSEEERDGVTIVDFSFAGHDPEFSKSTNGRTLAYLVKPVGDGPFAGVIFLHWLGRPQGSREQYLDEAVMLAQEHGVVSLLLQGYFPWMQTLYGDERDRDLIIGQVKALRRAVDYLVSQPKVDPERLAFIGHDYGALYGGILAGVEPRLKTSILIAGVSTFTDWAIYFNGIKMDEYAPLMEEVNPIGYVSQVNPGTILFQFGERDSYVSPELASTYYEAASEPKAIEWYDDLHQMANEEARQARTDWLIKELALAR